MRGIHDTLFQALDRVDLDVRAGELHVLFGETVPASRPYHVSAGLSRRTKARSGSVGEGDPPSHAAAGRRIGKPVSDISLIPSLAAEANLFLGREIPAKAFCAHARCESAQALIDELGFD